MMSTGGCKKAVPAAPSPKEAQLPPIEVLKDGRWLFTYVEPSGTFATTDKPSSVPEPSRKLVRVIDPAQGAVERRDNTSVYVVDLSDLLSSGKVQARVMSRGAFETGALAQLPPGESSLLADPRPGAPPEEPAAGTAAVPGTAPGGAPALAPGTAPVVTVYGTSWCGACRAARRYLSGKKIPFADKDVERDPAAARELAEKAARLGVPADRVPILDVRGRLLVGFDPARLEALLGEAT
jgi:glutaredoxin